MKKIQLGIRGGGVKSAVAIGVLRAFSECNIPISGISGTSIGSVVAALYAAGKDYREIFDLFKEYVVTYSNAAYIKGGKGSSVIEQTVNAECCKKTFNQIDIPLKISANSGGIWNTKEFVFNQENTPEITLGEACRASSSFPFIYGHYTLNINGAKMKFYDGGMCINPACFSQNTDSVFILASFGKEKENKKSRYAKAWLKPEELANIVIKPYVAKMGTLGTPQDVQKGYLLGYEAAMRMMDEISSIIS